MRRSLSLSPSKRKPKQERGETHLTLCTLVRLDAEANLGHGLLNHADAVRPLGGRVDALLRNLGRNVAHEVAGIVLALLLAYLELALC